MFQSFVWGGFECAMGVNSRGEWFDQIEATEHDRFLDEDYGRLAELGITTVRDAVRWPLVDRGGRMDFSSVDPMLEAAERHGIELILDLFHFGFPRGVDLFSVEFPERFEEYCYAVARHVVERFDGPVAFTPVNEPSYFAWAAGEAGLFAPHVRGRGWDLKIALAAAAIRGIDAIWSGFPRARIVNVDPICRVVAPAGCDEREDEVRSFNQSAVFQSYDILAGRLLPELGGSLAHLGTVGINYYWTNQWEIGRPEAPLCETDERLAPLAEMVRAVWQRYGVDVAITETSHVGDARAAWLYQLADEARSALDSGVPLRGVCLYPILGMPEWHDREMWTRMGLWDLEPRNGALARVLHAPSAEALAAGFAQFEGAKQLAFARSATDR
jgi:beta-glucosidase/6-phospho-beta-glucosidase/beta-galactosidase